MAKKRKKKSKWEHVIKTRHVKNGVLVEVSCDGDISEYVATRGNEDSFSSIEPDETEAFAYLLRILNEAYGPSTGRYSPKRIFIKIEPGDKTDLMSEDERYIYESLSREPKESYTKYGKRIEQYIKDCVEADEKAKRELLTLYA
jgi:hypothetical protein